MIRTGARCLCWIEAFDLSRLKPLPFFFFFWRSVRLAGGTSELSRCSSPSHWCLLVSLGMTIYIHGIFPAGSRLILHIDASQCFTAPAPSSVTQLSSQPCIPPSMLSMLAALHALFTAKLKYRAESESCMLRQLNRGGAVTTAESVCHRVITFFFFFP